jgi:hypothetical protein
LAHKRDVRCFTRLTMRQPSFRLLLWITIGVALPLMLWLAMPPSQASAQCGTRPSSCKTCHETQGKLRVNTKGDWHTLHSFGDFCVYCHAGNSQVKDKAKAHAGMVKPLDDVNGACGTCHADDYAVRAERYAQTLGVTIGTGSGTSALRGPAPLLPFTPQVAGVGDVKSPFDLNAPAPFAGSSAAPVSADIGDVQSVNWGNVALTVIAFVLLFGGGGFALWNERRLTSEWEKAVNARPELQELMPLLAKADPQTVEVITRTLAERGQ